ncbi:MAG: hypothetical protein LGR52_14235 [Candidatus Thiosymbion ectosymbiont of Robbea hypermnestra]|nr:hypothetical protein [Candidatus Thiosymbion ectosymbiont of Robbea hypermnestra]
MKKLCSGFVVSALVVLSYSASAYDSGYSDLPSARIDVNNDGRIDYCRFVGDSPNIFIACDIGTSNQYAYQSVKGIDQGYGDMPRGFKDINRDGYGDYCRCVGNSPTIFYSCNLGRSDSFDPDQYTANYPGTYCN